MATRAQQQKNLNKRYQRKYYSYLQSEPFNAIYDYAAQEVVNSKASSVVDIGCWIGMFCEALNRNNYNGQYLGLDLCSSAISEAKDKLENQKNSFAVYNWYDPPMPGKYDAMYMGGVFYYIKDKVGFLNRFVDAHNPHTVVIQDIQATDLRDIDNSYNVISTKEFFIDYKVYNDKQRQHRQIKTISLLEKKS